MSEPEPIYSIAEARSQIEQLKAENQRLREACRIYRDASMQSHDRHWDMQMTRGVHCPECIRANVLRNTADAILRQTETEVSDEQYE